MGYVDNNWQLRLATGLAIGLGLLGSGAAAAGVAGWVHWRPNHTIGCVARVGGTDVVCGLRSERVGSYWVIANGKYVGVFRITRSIQGYGLGPKNSVQVFARYQPKN